jgi:transcriptional regulator GlxA family with amidase domain
MTAAAENPLVHSIGFAARSQREESDGGARWVDAGKYVSSAGVSAGTDLGFYLVSRLAGRAVAEIAATAAEYDWHREPNQPTRN